MFYILYSEVNPGVIAVSDESFQHAHVLEGVVQGAFDDATFDDEGNMTCTLLRDDEVKLAGVDQIVRGLIEGYIDNGRYDELRRHICEHISPRIADELEDLGKTKTRELLHLMKGFDW